MSSARPPRARPRRCGSVSRYLGQMAALMGDWDRVETDFARAMRRNLETGARAEVAETRFDWADGPAAPWPRARP